MRNFSKIAAVLIAALLAGNVTVNAVAAEPTKVMVRLKWLSEA